MAQPPRQSLAQPGSHGVSARRHPGNPTTRNARHQPASDSRCFAASCAEADLEELYRWVVERAPQQGARWFNGLEWAVLSLNQHPKRCPVAPESFDADHPVRVLTYGRKPHAYRVFFTVDDDAEIVRVLHVRRGARQSPMAEEFRGD